MQHGYSKRAWKNLQNTHHFSISFMSVFQIRFQAIFQSSSSSSSSQNMQQFSGQSIWYFANGKAHQDIDIYISPYSKKMYLLRDAPSPGPLQISSFQGALKFSASTANQTVRTSQWSVDGAASNTKSWVIWEGKRQTKTHPFHWHPVSLSNLVHAYCWYSCWMYPTCLLMPVWSLCRNPKKMSLGTTKVHLLPEFLDKWYFLPKKTHPRVQTSSFSNLFAFFCTRTYISYNQKTPMKNLLFWHDFWEKTFPPIRTCKQIRLTNQFYPTPLIFFPAKEHWWWWKCLNFLAVASS